MNTTCSSISIGKSMTSQLTFNFSSGNEASRVHDLETVVNTIDGLIEKSFKSYSISSDSIGVLLSGGLDSTLTLAYIKKTFPDRKIFTYTLGYSNEDVHLGSARSIAETFGTTHREVIYPIGQHLFEIMQEIGQMEYHFEFEDSFIMNHILAKEVKKDCTIVFSGFGLDYVFAGMDLFRNSHNEDLYKKGLVDMRYILDSVSGNKYYCKYLLEKFTHQDLGKEYFIKYGEYYGDLLHENLESEAKQEFLRCLDSFPQDATVLQKQIYYSVLTSLAKRFAPYNEPYALQGVAHYSPFGDPSFIQNVLDLHIPDQYLYNPYTQEKKYIIQRLADRYIASDVRSRLHKGTVLSYHEPFLKNKQAIIDQVHTHREMLEKYIRSSVFLALPEFIQESIWFENSKKVLILLQLIFWIKM